MKKCTSLFFAFFLSFVSYEALAWGAYSGQSNVVKTVGDQTVAGSKTFTSITTFEHDVSLDEGTPILQIIENDQAANDQCHEISMSGGVLSFSARDNTCGVAGHEDWLEVTRSGLSVTTVDFPNGDVNITDSLTSSKACASGYTRISPNYCTSDTPSASYSLTRDACTTITAPAADSKIISIQLSSAAKSNNGVLTRVTTIASYNDSGCITQAAPVITAYAREDPALSAGNFLALNSQNVFIKSSSAGSDVYLKLTDDAGNQGTGFYNIIGYYD